MSTRPVLDLAPILDAPLPATWKGVPRAAVGTPLGAIGSQGFSVLHDDLPFPVALLKDSALAHNAAWMAAFAERAGASLAPHGKTTMAPQLFARQLAAGAWGMTAATASHGTARPLQGLLEVGMPGGRTGVRSVDEGLALGRALRDAAPSLALCGIEAFEGIGMSGDADAESQVHALMANVVSLFRAGASERWFADGEVLLSAGGSAFFDIAAAELAAASGRDVRVVLRSGCYLSHDALHYDAMQPRIRARAGALFGPGPGLRNALEVWSVVQSVPEPGRAIVALGKRDLSHDLEPPRPLVWFRDGEHDTPQPVLDDVRVAALNDHHAYVDGPLVDAWRPGDLVGFGVGHPCTTFDKWPLVYVVDDAYRVVEGIRTFF